MANINEGSWLDDEALDLLDEMIDEEAEQFANAHPEHSAAVAKNLIAWYTERPEQDPAGSERQKCQQRLDVWYAAHPGQEPRIEGDLDGRQEKASAQAS